MNSLILEVVITVLTLCVGWITKESCGFIKSKGLLAKIEHNKVVINVVVHAIEQIYKDLNGSEKLEKAKLEAVDMLNEKNIHVSDKELDMMIEASVKEMKRVAKEELKK